MSQHDGAPCNVRHSNIELLLPTGNLARFVNHSCSPNCVIVSVLTEESTNPASVPPSSSSGLCYRICLFAEQEIPAFTEIVYNYSECHTSFSPRDAQTHVARCLFLSSDLMSLCACVRVNAGAGVYARS